MMLDHPGLADQSACLMRAVATIHREGKTLTPSQGEALRTDDFCSAVARRLSHRQ
jgi:isocitrate/isopropylmalate dehydrogenase